MIFGKHINRYYLKYALWLIAGLGALVLVDFPKVSAIVTTAKL